MRGKPMVLLLAWYCCLHLTAATRTHREHKVHNIVLYPDKHSWCKTTPIKQVVAWPGCVAREIDNNVCVGACFSYTIPQTEPSAPGDVISPYCDSCQPSEVKWLENNVPMLSGAPNTQSACKAVNFYTFLSGARCSYKYEQSAYRATPDVQHVTALNVNRGLRKVKWSPIQVTLECTNEEETVETLAPEPTTTPQPNISALAANLSSTPLLMQKRVQVIANCSCSACHGHGHHHTPSDHSGDSDVHHQPSLLDVPELMGLMRQVQTRKLAVNHSSANHHPAPHVPHLPISLPDVLETEEEEKKDESVVGSTEPAPVVPLSAAAESLALPSAAFEPPVALPDDTSSHGHHVHAHHAHAHHPHHHGHHHTPAHLEVPQEKLQPAQEGAEMSYHDNLVPSDQSQEKDEEF